MTNHNRSLHISTYTCIIWYGTLLNIHRKNVNKELNIIWQISVTNEFQVELIETILDWILEFAEIRTEFKTRVG